MRDTDEDDDDGKSRYRRKRVRQPKDTNQQSKSRIISQVVSKTQDSDDDDDDDDDDEVDVKVPHQKPKSRISSQEMSKTQDSDEDEEDDDDDVEEDVKVPNPKPKSRISSQVVSKTQDSEDEEDDDDDDVEDDVKVPNPKPKSRISSQVVSKTQDSEDEEDDDDDDVEDDVKVPNPKPKSRISSQVVSKTQDSEDEEDEVDEMEEKGDQFAEAQAHLEEFISSLHNSSKVKNSTQVSQSLVIELLHANQELKQKEFEVSLELLIRFVAYQQPLSNFFIMCESAPYIFAEEVLSDDNEAENTSIVNSSEALVNNGTRRTNLIKSAQVYLSKLSENLLKFIRLYRKQIQSDDSVDILAQLYRTIPPQTLQKYGALLNLAEVRKMICDVTREDDMFYQLSRIKKFKNCRHFLMNHLIDKFCSRDVTTLTTNDARKNILIIMHNLEIYKPGADKYTSPVRINK